MTRWLQAAVAAERPADRTDKTDETRLTDGETAARQRPQGVLSVLSVLSGRSEWAKAALPKGQDPEITPRFSGPTEAKRFPYGCAPNGNPRTWTGRIVSLDDWRSLSEWDRHGSTGKLWNALSGRWEAANTGDKSNSAAPPFQSLGPSVAPDLEVQ